MSSLADKIKAAGHAVASLAIEDDGQGAKPVAKPAVSAHPAFNLPPNFSSAPQGGFAAATAPSAGSPFAVPGSVVVDEKTYQSVLNKTNFDNTPVGKTIHKYYDALDGVIADQTQRFRAAIGQACKLDGITPDQVLATFDQMSAALDSDGKGFQGVADGVEAKEITARQQKVQQITDQIAQLQQQVTQLNADLADASASHSNAVQQYGLASQRRASEIAQQKAQFASLLR